MLRGIDSYYNFPKNSKRYSTHISVWSDTATTVASVFDGNQGWELSFCDLGRTKGQGLAGGRVEVEENKETVGDTKLRVFRGIGGGYIDVVFQGRFIL